jgi:hypothetical protein
MFDYRSGRFFQYRVDMSTSDPSSTPELSGITFTFNLAPDVPSELEPVVEGWVSGSNPEFSWTFTDPDTDDHQTAIELQIASDEELWYKEFSSGIVELVENSYEIPMEIDDGVHYWRMRVRDNYHSWSDWSDTISFNVDSTAPPAPKIDCYTHPLSNLWYANDQPRFDWNEPVDATGIAGYSYMLDQYENSEPAQEIMMTSEEFMMKRNVADFNGFLVQDDVLEDGTWYFHLRAVDNMGHRSDTATKAVRVDKTPPALTDLTPSEIDLGHDLEFRTVPDEVHSGIDSVLIYWRYSSEIDFLVQDMLEQDDGSYLFSIKVKSTSDPSIEYYVVASDRAEPANELRLPLTGHSVVSLNDDVAPEISVCTGDISQSAYHDLSITVETTDNVGISRVVVFFNGETNGLELSRKIDGSYNIEIDRNEVLKMSGGVANAQIEYYIMVWDHSDNTARIPEEGNYLVTLKDLEDPGDKPKKDKDDVSTDGLFEMLLANIIVLVAIVVFVALMLFFFIRKQSENIYKDRHKLRMAIADVSEGAKTGSTDILPPVGMAPAENAQSLPQADAGISYDPGAASTGPALPPTTDIMPGPSPLPPPVPRLPPARADRNAPVPAPLERSAPTIRYTKPVNVQTNAPLAGPEEVIDKGRSVDEPSSTDLRVFGSNNNPGKQPSLRVELKPGVSVSLPKDN